MAPGLDSRLLDHLLAERLFDRPGLGLLAVSGGLDSVALLDVMCSIKDDLDLNLAVAHVSHGISAESAEAVPRVEEMARSYGLPFYLRELALGPAASETTARDARYAALRSVQTELGAEYLVTAHHRDDQIETVLLRFLRGTGMAGLAGIPASGPEGLTRPLLPFGRDELEEWLYERFPDPAHLPSIFDDPENANKRHDRSWIRHELLPILRDRYGSDVDARVHEVGVHAARENGAWSGILRVLPDLEFNCDRHAVEVARLPLERYDKLLSEGVLRAAAREVGCLLGKRRAAALLELSIDGPSGRVMQLGSGWEAAVVFDKLRIQKAAECRSAPAAVRLDLEKGTEGDVSWGRWKFTWREATTEKCPRDSFAAWFTYGACEIRPPEEGDRIWPLGGVGSRKLRRVLMEARVSFRDRDSFPILVRGSDVLWVPGVCRSAVAVPEMGEPAVRMEACGD